MKKNLAKFLPAFLSAGLAVLAFPPFNLLFLVFVALAPWLGYLRTCTPKEARKSGYVFGLIYFGAQMFWVFIFVNQWVGNPALALLPWVVTMGLGAPFYALLGGLIHRCWAKNWAWAIPVIWAGCEGVRVFLPGLSFPWALIGLPLARVPALVQMASLGTVFLVSAWVVIANVLIAMFLFPPKGETSENFVHGRVVVRLGIAFIALMLVPGVRMLQIPPGTKKVFTLAQPGIDMAFSPRATRPTQMAMAGLRLMRAAVAQNADLVVFPEGFGEESTGIPPISCLGDHPEKPTIFGTIRTDGPVSHQSAYAYDGKWQFADKTRLVIFGEYVPFRDQLPFLQSFNLPSGDLTPGKVLSTPTVNHMKLGPMICFEAVFAELAEAHQRQGAQVLVQMSIDDWYEKTPAHEQLWLMSVWRSIESGLPLVRVGSRGRTLATDSRGRVIAIAPVGVEIPLRVEVNIPDAGDGFLYRTWFIWLSIASVGILFLENLISVAKRRGEKSSSQKI